ncbi:MAG: hypothetical protein RLZZ546_216 [Bacteroidota bacterium]|jgi:hypothetical protein
MLIKKHSEKNFIFFLIVFLLFSCKNESNENKNHTNGEEEWLEDYESPNIKWGFLDKNGKVAIDLMYDDVRDFNDGLAIANLKGKWGYIDKKGNAIIPFSYLNAYEFHDSLARVQDFDKKFYFIDKSGKKRFECLGNDCSDFETKTAIFTKDEMKGLINNKGEKIVDAAFSSIKKINDSKFIVSQGELYGVIDFKGNFIIKPQYEKINILDNNNLSFKKDGLYQWFDTNTLKPKSEKKYKKLSQIQGEYLVAKDEKSSTIVDVDGKEYYKSQGELLLGGEGFWIEILNESSQLIDKHGNKIGPPYQQLYKMSNGIIGFQKDDLWGYMDNKGKEVVPPSFTIIWDAYEDRIRFANEYGYGFMDLTGKLKVLPKFVEARDYKDGLARVASF